MRTDRAAFADNKKVIRKLLLLLLLTIPLLAGAQGVLRGNVRVELEPMQGFYMDVHFPLDHDTAYTRALELAALLFSAQIYGWSFHFDIGERARGIAEEFELTPMGEIFWGDPRLFVTKAYFHNHNLSLWADYRPAEHQQRRLAMWSKGNIRAVQGTGFAFVGGGSAEEAEWLSVRKRALEDAARTAVRAMLQGSERNRPRQATGYISLERFPRFWIDSGRWAAHARFRVEVRDIIPFAVH